MTVRGSPKGYKLFYNCLGSYIPLSAIVKIDAAQYYFLCNFSRVLNSFWIIQRSVIMPSVNNSSLPGIIECCQGKMRLPISVILVILNCLSAAVALTGNTIVLTVICQLKTRSVSHYLIASLSVADLLVGLVMNPILVAKILLGIWQGDHWLSVTADFMWIQMTASTSLSLCAVSYDRFIAIKSVFHYQKFLSKKKAIALAICIWIFSIVLASLRLLLHKYPQHLAKLWLGATLITVLMPLIFIGYCYFHIYTAAKLQMRKIARNELSRKQTKVAIRNKKAALTVAIVIGLFVSLWIPTLAASITELFMPATCEARKKIDFAWFWVAFLSFLSSAINPWIYAFRIHEFRTFLKHRYSSSKGESKKGRSSFSKCSRHESCGDSIRR